MVLGPIVRHSDTASGSTKSAGTRIGYTRVSTVAQTLDQQNEALGAAGVTGFNLYSMIVAVIGAVLVLVIYHLVTGRRAVV